MRRLFSISILLLLCAIAGHAAIGYDSTTAVSTASIFTATVAANSNRWLGVGCTYYSSAGTINSMTYAGSAMTKVSRFNDGTHAATVEVWKILSPSTGTNNVSIAWGTQPANFGCTALSLYNVNQSTDIDTSTSHVVFGTSASNPGTITTANANEWILNWVLAGAAVSAGSSQANVQTLGISSGGFFGSSATGPFASPGSQAQTWTYASNNAASMEALVALVPDTITSAPTLSSISPSGSGQSTAPTVTLTGNNFIAGASVAVSGTGITISNTTIVNTSTITATFTMASNATLGARNVTVTTSGGTSSAVTFTVQSVLITTTAIPISDVGKAYGSLAASAITMTASGGATPYAWSKGAGCPSWLSINSSTGVLSGTPSSPAASATCTITVTDNAMATNSVAFPLETNYAAGIGCTDAHHIDHDCDGYGKGSPVGEDADDESAAVNTESSWEATYGPGAYNAFTNWIVNKKGYTSARYIFLDATNGTSSCSLGQTPDPSITNFNHPCQSVGQALALQTTGDALVFRTGTYDVSSIGGLVIYKAWGTATHDGAILAFPGESVNVTGTNMNIIAANTGICTGPWKIDGVNLYNPASTITSPSPLGQGIADAGVCAEQNVAMRNLEIHNLKRGIWFGCSCTNLVIENNYVHDERATADEGHNMYIFNDPQAGPQVGLIVRGNVMGNADWNNFHTAGVAHTVLIDGNILYSADMDVQSTGPATMSFDQSWHDVTVSNNIFFLASGGGGGIQLNTYRDYQNNADNFPVGLYNFTVVNNTFLMDGYISTGRKLNSQGGSNVNGPIISIENTSGYPGVVMGHNIWENNIFALTNQNVAIMQYCKTPTTVLSGNGNANGTTTFVNTTSPDFAGFTQGVVGHTITIAGVAYTIASWVGINTITTTVAVPTGSGVSWSITGMSDNDWWATDTWRNNVIYTSSGAAFIKVGNENNTPPPLDQCDATATVLHDVTWFNANVGTVSPALPPSNNITTNPLFAAANSSALFATPGLFDLDLTVSSPAINAGLASAQPALDIRGVTRTNPDNIGAYSGSTAAPTCTITTTSVPQGTVGQGYSTTLAQSGCNSSTWSVTTKPSGTSLNTSTGVVSGTLTTAQILTGTASYDTGTSSTLTWTVNAAPSITTASPMPAGVTGTAYNQTLTTAGGTGALAFSVTAGALPTGVTLNASSGVISGTPSATCSCTFTITATDTNGVTGSKALAITVTAPSSNPVISTTTLPNARQNVFYSQLMAASQGTPPFTWSISAGSLPTGLALGSSTGIISGGPSVAGSYSFTVKVTDANTNFATQAFNSFAVLPPGGASQRVGTSNVTTQ